MKYGAGKGAKTDIFHEYRRSKQDSFSLVIYN